MNKQKTIKQIEEEMPETMKNGLIRKARNSNKEDFDLEEAIKDICDGQIEFYNHFKSNDKFREKFSEMMFSKVCD